MLATVLAAAAPPAAEKGIVDRLSEVPLELWIKVGVGLLALIAVVVLIRFFAQFNKLILGFILLIAFSFVGFTWIYERNEPAWATPFVAWLAEFLPTKGRK